MLVLIVAFGINGLILKYNMVMSRLKTQIMTTTDKAMDQLKKAGAPEDEIAILDKAMKLCFKGLLERGTKREKALLAHLTDLSVFSSFKVLIKYRVYTRLLTHWSKT